MKYQNLGKTGMKVSRLCLGTMNFGPNTPEEEAFRIMDAALDAGINFFDTANMYGGRNGGYRGWTEDIIGRWFAQGDGRRARVVLATKVFERMEDPVYGPNDAPGLSSYKIRRHVDDCLRRLQTDHIEVLYLHGPDDTADWNEIWEAMEVLRIQGKIDYVAASNFAVYQLMEGQHAADLRHETGIVCAQNCYNLTDRRMEIEVIPALRRMGLGFLVWGPLAGGLLSGSVLRDIMDGQRSAKYAGKLSPAELEQIRSYHELCEGYGYPEAEVALAWLLSLPYINASLIGPRTLQQLEEQVSVADRVYPEELFAEAERIFPAPSSPYFGLSHWREKLLGRK